MTSLALNPVLPGLLRWRVQLALKLLPFTLAIAATFPAVMLGVRLPWVFLGLPIALQVIAFAGLVVGFVTLGYGAGWWLNVIFCRWLLGWPTESVRAIFLHSDVPGAWLKASARPQGSNLHSVSLSACEGLLSRSAIQQLMLRALLTGLCLGGAMAVFTVLEHANDLAKTLSSFLKWFLGGAASGLVGAAFQRHRLREYHRRLTERVPGRQ